MPNAIWNYQVTAKAPACKIHRVEGNIYFPLSAAKQEYLLPCNTRTRCRYKDIASDCGVAEA